MKSAQPDMLRSVSIQSFHTITEKIYCRRETYSPDVSSTRTTSANSLLSDNDESYQDVSNFDEKPPFSRRTPTPSRSPTPAPILSVTQPLSPTNKPYFPEVDASFPHFTNMYLHPDHCDSRLSLQNSKPKSASYVSVRRKIERRKHSECHTNHVLTPNDVTDQNNQLASSTSSLVTVVTVHQRVTSDNESKMSSDGGGTAVSDGEGGGVMDFKQRIQRYQPNHSKHKPDNVRVAQDNDHTSSTSQETHQQQQLLKQSQQITSSCQQQQTQDQLQQHSVSMSNLSKLKSSMSEMKSSIDEMTSSNSAFSCSSNIQQASSSVQSSSQSKIQSSSQSALSSSNLKASQSTTALKSSNISSSSSKSVESKSINALQSNFKNFGSSEKLAEFGLSKDKFALQNDQFDENQLIEFKDPGELLLQDSEGLLADCDQPQLDQLGSSSGINGAGVTTFEQKKVTSSSKRKVTTDNNCFESASGSSSQSTRVQAGDVTYSECQQQAAARSKMEKDGVTEEKEAALQQEARQLKAGDDITHTEGSQKMGASVRVTGQDFSSHKSAVSEAQQRRTVTPAGTISAENSRKLSKSGLTITTKGVCTKQSSSMSSSESNISVSGFEDFDLGGAMQPMDVQNAIMKYSGVMTKFVDQLKTMSLDGVVKAAPTLLDHMNDMMKRAWSVPTYGHELGYSLCNVLKNNGGLDILLENCTSKDSKLKFSSAKVLEQCLTTENRGYVVEKGLENVVNVACDCTQDNRSMEQSRVGTGILEHLFKHSEGTCSDIIRMGGLEAVVRECRKKDVETLRHCAGALANLSLYGGSENQQAMVQRQVAIWLFPLAFHDDDNIKYYACLAIAALVANAEIEAQVLKADTLSLIEPFVNSHLPEEFANSTVAHRHGQSRDWLERLVPVLSSKREEARNLAAFHFCMEAGIKKNQGNIEIFREIDAIEPLKKVASSPNAIASKYAAHALRLMGEEVPHKLSQQVPLWQATDVQEWVKQIGFSQYADAFIASRVDGDLLLQIGEDNLTYDIGITNGILRQRFLRELKRLRQITDYSSKDPTGLNSFMLQLGPEFAEYTYKMLLSGATKNTLRFLTDEQLASECGIVNSIHRQRLKEGVIVYEKCRKIVKNKKNEASTLQDSTQLDKTLDVFISYRRSNGSQLASLLKVHMQLKGFSVFIDVERLEAGKFDNNLLGSIRQARNFLLVLTPSALDRCLGDHDCKDWVHKEIVAALDSGCNIIPIIDNFHWPEPEQLPDDMRAVCYFNGVRWIHDYQDACVDKLERFMRGEGSLRGEPPGSLGRYQSTTMLTQPGTPSPLPRVQPVYQRTTSTESGKGSSCSDKDFTGKD
ncbi:NAD(+) hydrolase sarm1 isoform X3 [Hyalella azteca]|uniref:ADP-ribosyl cyclase/cyclic ADP-ribose hydrolase n=1 Tax=Hyalella azteca TaxID=294128 RepID=A0A8B7P359_HYAAZ|nr:NAD(+) hydrolase sarm1 isoform X3 [Hyalella azteca]